MLSPLYIPVTHAVHTAEAVAAGTLLKVPAAHAVQAEVPVVSPLYMPAAHAVQTADVLAADTAPYPPATHTVQEERPVMGAANTRELYVPSQHAVHAPGSTWAGVMLGDTDAIAATCLANWLYPAGQFKKSNWRHIMVLVLPPQLGLQYVPPGSVTA